MVYARLSKKRDALPVMIVNVEYTIADLYIVEKMSVLGHETLMQNKILENYSNCEINVGPGIP